MAQAATKNEVGNGDQVQDVVQVDQILDTYHFQVDPDLLTGELLIMIDEQADKPRAWYTLLATFLHLDGQPVPFERAFSLVTKLNLTQTQAAYQQVNEKIAEVQAAMIPPKASGP